MIKLTFLIDEDIFRYCSELILDAAPEGVDPKMKEATELTIREILKGEDESFLTIDPHQSLSEDATWDTFTKASFNAVYLKACEIVLKDKSQNHER